MTQFAAGGLFEPGKIAAILRTASEELALTVGLGKGVELSCVDVTCDTGFFLVQFRASGQALSYVRTTCTACAELVSFGCSPAIPAARLIRIGCGRILPVFRDSRCKMFRLVSVSPPRRRPWRRPSPTIRDAGSIRIFRWAKTCSTFARSLKGFKKSFLQLGEAGISNIEMAGAKHQAALAKGQTLSGSGIGTVIRLSSASNSLACVKRPDWLFSGFRLSVSDHGSS